MTSRRSGGRWYVLYVSHQVVFPLSAGVVTVGRATVTYVRPLSYSFLSRELQHEVQSESLFVAVDPQPAEGRPGDFSGAAGRALAVALQTSDSTLTAGGAATVSVTIAGIGNVALWPEPRVAWPPGIRIYPTGTDVEVEGQEGLVGGTKRFRYLVIADSAGAHLIPGLSYPYFDTALRDYAVAAAPGARLVAPPGLATVPPRPLPAPLLPRDPASLAERIAGLARWLWLGLLVLPPLAFAALQALARLPRRRPHASASERDAQALEALGRELRQALERRAGSAAPT